MPGTRTQQTDVEEVASLRQANAQLKRELLAARRQGSQQRVQQLTQHVHELEDVIISMKVLNQAMHSCPS